MCKTFIATLFTLFFFSYACMGVAENEAYKHELVVCAIFKNEAPYLEEWLDYHLSNGVEKFYLYNHMSMDDYKIVLDRYIKNGQVKLIEWDYPEWPKAQLEAYKHAIHYLKEKAKWAAMIDIDEFIVCNTEKITNFLKEFETYAGIAINWQIFGTSHIRELGDRPLLENMIHKAPYDYDNLKWGQSNRWAKSIIRPERINENSNHPNCGNHIFEPKDSDNFIVNENHEPLTMHGKLATVSIEKAQINHYWFRDEKFFFETKIERRESVGEKFSTKFIKKILNDCNQIEDLRIQKRHFRGSPL